MPRPDRPVCIVGDVHGMGDHLRRLLDLIARQPGAEAARIILAGDLIDRGPDSAAVLSEVRARCDAVPDRVICLMGNHERMMLDFLADPAGAGARWLSNGGAETLASFGVQGRVHAATPADRFAALAQRLAGAMPAGLVDWVAGRPLWWREGALAVAHAGADPTRPVEDQDPQALLWGHGAFRRAPRADGIWIAHGHTIVAAPEARAGRIAVDTGAFATGRLSAAWLDARGLRFLQVE